MRPNPRTAPLRLFLAPFLAVTTLFLSSAMAVAPLAAQPLRPEADPAALEGQTIQDIQLVGLRTLTEDTVLYYLGLEVGEPLVRERLDRDIKRLWERELIDDVSVEAVPVSGGVQLVVSITERPVVRSIEYEGLERISRTDIEDRLSRERIDLQEGGPLNLGELYRLKAAIEDLYAEKGYRFAVARYATEPVTDGERRIVFTIDEGDQVRIGDIRFEGNTVYREGRLRWEMKDTKESGPFTRLFKKDVYNPASMAEDLDRVRDLYRSAGYKNVVIGEPRLQVEVGNPDAPTISEQERELVITIPVEEGNRWRFGEVRVEGNEIFTDEGLLRAFQYRPGDWLRSESVDEGVEAVQEVYQNSGYIQAVVEPELVEISEDEADVVIYVSENDQYRIGRIEFEGNTRTMDKVLRRELRVQEGRVLSLGGLRNSLFKIRQLGYFELNEEEPVTFEFEEDNTVNLTIKGEEADRTELQFGAGYSEGLGFFGQFAARTQNFLGRGERLGVNIQEGALTSYYEVSYFVPWLLDRPQSAGIQLFNREIDYDIFDSRQVIDKTIGGSLSYGRSLGLFSSLGVTYSRFDREYRQTFVDFDGEVSDLTFLQDISSLRPTFVYNSVDNRFEPRVGQRFQTSLEYAGGILGGNTDYWRPVATYTLYQPVTGYPLETVFGANVEVGWTETFGGRDLEPFDLFRLGGENSVRGFDRGQLYARDENTNEILLDENGFPLGGDRYFQLNLEYHLLLNDPFRVIFFVDAGNLYAPGQSFDLGRLRTTAGAELRLTLPLLGGAPLRFIYAFNLDEQAQDQFNSFSFSIGSTF